MMRTILWTYLLLIGLVWGLQAGEEPEQNVLKKYVPLTVEKSLSVSLDFGNGYIQVARADSGMVFQGRFVYEEDKPGIHYDIFDETGELRIRFGEGSERDDEEERHSISSFNDLYENEVNLRLSPEIPIEFNGELGVVKGKLDFSGLPLRTLDLDMGVSKVDILFEEPNPITLEECNLRGGVGKFAVRKLGNAHFRHLEFEGGLGSYVLNLTGDIQGKVTANIELGLGKLVLILPRKVGTRIQIEKSFFSSFSIDECYKKGDYYYNEAWNNSRNQLDVHIETGMGRVRVEWSDE